MCLFFEIQKIREREREIEREREWERESVCVCVCFHLTSIYEQTITSYLSCLSVLKKEAYVWFYASSWLCHLINTFSWSLLRESSSFYELLHYEISTRRNIWITLILKCYANGELLKFHAFGAENFEIVVLSD